MKTILKNSGNLSYDIIIDDDKFSSSADNIQNVIDLNGDLIYAGLLDIHAHGCMGFDSSEENSVAPIAQYLAKHGTTSWLPTTMTVDMEDIKKVTSNMPSLIENGADILGFHLEGPYISSKYKGAQNEKYIKAPDLDEFNSIENVKMITIAPELSGSIEFIKNCDAVVTLGHTDADYEKSVEAIKAGASCLTHTFNAMPPLHHRNPGPIGAAIDENIYVQVICDGIHIHKSVIKMLYKTFGSDRMILISDSIRPMGLEDGNYVAGKLDVTIKNGVARLLDGTIAGSTSTLLDCVKKAIEFGIPQDEAFKMASETPAQLMNVKKGLIKEGYDADLIRLNKNLELVGVMVGGKWIEM